MVQLHFRQFLLLVFQMLFSPFDSSVLKPHFNLQYKTYYVLTQSADSQHRLLGSVDSSGGNMLHTYLHVIGAPKRGTATKLKKKPDSYRHYDNKGFT
jgi:hypothetical protein